MFNCAVCHATSLPGVRPIKVVTETRDRTYTNEKGKVTKGWEIVKEVNMCYEDAFAHELSKKTFEPAFDEQAESRFLRN